MKRVSVLVLCVICLGASALAQEAPEVKDKVVYVAAFKNGLGFFLREGEAKLQSGWGVSHVVPEAAHGTFWIAPMKDGARLDQLVAFKQDVTKSEPAVSIRELLSENIGKTATLTVGDKSYTGRITAVPEARKPDDSPPQPSRYAASELANIVILRTEASTGQNPGTVVVNISQITSARIEGEANTTAAVKRTEQRMKFKITGCGDTCPVSTAYIQKGITWAPSYLVELTGKEGKARITMQGVLANDVEDLDGANVSFVVGYPNFVYADVLSPLSLRQSVGEFIRSLTSGGTGDGRYAGRYGRVMAQSAAANIAYYDESPAQPAFTYSSVTGTPGAQEEDLFLYRKTGVTLKKGERGYYDIFSAVVPFEHIYEWDSPDESRIDPYGSVSSYSSDQKPVIQNQVWHKLKLRNTSDYPWTTAPAFTLNNHQPLAEDVLDYTSKGGTSKLKLTVATDIKARAAEEELSRVEAKLSGYNYWRVTSKGRLSVKSFKTRPVRVQVVKHLTGEVTETSDEGKSTKTVQGIKAVNPASTVTWSIPLKPGEEKTVDYTYTTLVRY